MGIFSFNQGSYRNAGKGVDKEERTLIRPLLFFTTYFGKYGKILLGNLLFLLLCIPVVTIGPATAAYVYVLKTLEQGRHSFVVSDFFEHFKKNLFQGFVVFLLNLLVGYSLYLVIANFNIVYELPTFALPNLQNFFVPLLAVCVIVLMMDFYIWPMMVTYDLSTGALLKNAFIFAMVRLPMNLLIVVALLAILAVIYGFVYFLSMVLSGLMGLLAVDPAVFRILALAATVFLGSSMALFLSVFYVMPTIRKNMEGADLKFGEEE